MRQYGFLLVILLILAAFGTTGFQCSSAEITSARIYVQQKNWPKAEDACLKEIAKNEKNEEAWYTLGQVRYEMRRYPVALDAFTKAASLSDAHKADVAKYRMVIWQTSFNDGVKFFNAARDTSAYFDTALASFKNAILAEPDSAMTYFVAGRAKLGLKDMKGATDYFETAMTKNPRYAEAASALGDVHYSMGIEKLGQKDQAGADAEFQKSAASYETAYNLAPDNTNTITALIEVLDRTKNPAKALTITRDAIAREPNNKVFRYALGVFLLQQAEGLAANGQFDSAGTRYSDGVDQFKKALDIDPAYAEAVYNCGVSYLNWGVTLKSALDKKMESKKRGTPVDPKDEAAYKEKFKLALPYLEKAVETHGDDVALLQQLGKVYMLMNMSDKSKEVFSKIDKLTKSK